MKSSGAENSDKSVKERELVPHLKLLKFAWF